MFVNVRNKIRKTSSTHRQVGKIRVVRVKIITDKITIYINKMKQKIILKESQLNRLIEESVKNVLREENKLTIRNVTEERKCRKEAFRLLHEKAKTAN